MAKKLVSVWLSATILLFSTIAIYADEKVEGQFLNRNININGTTLENYYLEKPLLLYGGLTYLPLTEEMGEFLGFDYEVDWESNTLKIYQGKPERIGLKEKVLKNNLKNCPAIVVRGLDAYTVTENEKDEKHKNFVQAILDFPLGKDADGHTVAFGDRFFKNYHKTERAMDTASYPLLISNDTLYVPVRAFTEDSDFGWDVFYDNYSGVYISTDKRIRAISLFDKRESDYNRGLANYIISKNKNITLGWALNLVFLFKHEAEIHDVDELLLIAIAQKESTFQYNLVGRKGPVGIMQIMPKTAAGFGISKEALLDPHVNIEFGARYIKGNLDRYENNEVVALSAYNQGSGAIRRGTYTTRYAGKVQGAQDSIENYLINKGYIKTL